MDILLTSEYTVDGGFGGNTLPGAGSNPLERSLSVANSFRPKAFAHCLLPFPIAYCPLAIANCLFAIAYCPLAVAFDSRFF